MKPFVIILFLLCFCSCERFLDSLESGVIPLSEPSEEKAVYMSGLEYPDGYDWKRDTAYGEVRCTLFLMKNGERILERPAGYLHDTASDFDMHRIIWGQLYEDHTSDKETVVYRNGEILWKWEGCLMVNDMIACGGDIYTLTSPRKGRGCALHRNEETVFESWDGSPASGLATDNGQVFFSIIGDDRTWKVFFKGKTSSIDTGNWNVCRASLVDGDVRAICESNGNVAYFINGKTMDIGNFTYKFYKLDLTDIDGKNFTLAGPAENGLTGEKGYCVRRQNGDDWYDEGNFLYCSFCCFSGEIWILGYLPDEGKCAILHNGEVTRLPEGFVPSPGKAMSYTGCGISVSLTKEGKAAVWMNGELTEYSFNGYIDNIS